MNTQNNLVSRYGGKNDTMKRHPPVGMVLYSCFPFWILHPGMNLRSSLM